MTVETPCFKCTNFTATHCSKCKVIAYCSKDCQTKDWKIHKIFCSSLPFPQSQKTTKFEKITGILFNPNNLIPSLVEIELNIKFENNMLPDTILFIGATESFNYMQSNHFKKRNLRDTLVFAFRDNFLNDGSPINKCVQKIYKGKNNYPWCGPVLVMKMKGLNVCENKYADMTPQDFEDVVDYFCWYGKTEESRFESTLEEVNFKL